MVAATRMLAVAGLMLVVGAGSALADGPRGGDFRAPYPGRHLPPNGNPGPFPPRPAWGGGWRPGGGYWPTPGWPGRYPGGWAYGRPYWPTPYGGWYGHPRW